jgi:hypothetical protein
LKILGFVPTKDKQLIYFYSRFINCGIANSFSKRHASEVRRLRGLKGWITGNERGAGMPAATQAVYDGEEV